MTHLINQLINTFSKFPGVGPKTASRYVYFLLNSHQDEIDKLIQLIKRLKQEITQCQICFNFSSLDPCDICRNHQRDHSQICVVSKPQQMEIIEKTNRYNGLYHILGGVINHLEGVGPEKLKIKELIKRIKNHKNQVREVILAFNPTMEGETTALYLKKMLAPYKIKITRLGRGLPMGADLEYADEITLTDALNGRKEI